MLSCVVRLTCLRINFQHLRFKWILLRTRLYLGARVYLGLVLGGSGPSSDILSVMYERRFFCCPIFLHEVLASIFVVDLSDVYLSTRVYLV